VVRPVSASASAAAAAVGAEEAAPTPPSSWACPQCTFINTNTFRCAICTSTIPASMTRTSRSKAITSPKRTKGDR
jgi:hypothetical protein